MVIATPPGAESLDDVREVEGRAILSAAGTRGLCPALSAREAADGFLLGLVSLEHSEELRDGEQVLNPLRQVQQLSLPPWRLTVV